MKYFEIKVDIVSSSQNFCD